MNMKKWKRTLALLMVMLLMGVSGRCEQILGELPNGPVLYEANAAYLDVTEATAEYAARRAIVYGLASYSFLGANGVSLTEEEFQTIVGGDMEAYLASDEFAAFAEILREQYGMGEEIRRAVRAQYWLQYIDGTLNAFWQLQESLGYCSAQTLRQEFVAKFDANLEFPDDGSVAVFAGEAIPWTEEYRLLTAYSTANSRIAAANEIAVNTALERYAEENELNPDLSQAEKILRDACAQAEQDDNYPLLLLALKKTGISQETYNRSMLLFVRGELCRKAFGRHCSTLYQKAKAEGETADVETFYYEQLDRLTRGWKLVGLRGAGE